MLNSFQLLSLFALIAPLHPGGMLDRKVIGTAADFARARQMIVRYEAGACGLLIEAALGLDGIPLDLCGGAALCRWSGAMSVARLNHIARTTGVISIEAFEVGGTN
jgi:hypothetical protein